MIRLGPVVRGRLADRPHRLDLVGTDGDLRDVDVAVGLGEQAEVLLPRRLAVAGELRRRAARRRLGGLPAGVGVDLGVEHHDVDVVAARQHVVEAAEVDVVGPAVAADDPHRHGHERVREARERRGPVAGDARQPRRAAARRARAAARCRPRPRGPARRRAARGPAPRPPRPPSRRVGAGPRRAGRRPPPACRVRTRRCPRTGSCSTPDPARPRSWPTASWAGCRRRSTSSRWHWRPPCDRRTAG